MPLTDLMKCEVSNFSLPMDMFFCTPNAVEKLQFLKIYNDKIASINLKGNRQMVQHHLCKIIHWSSDFQIKSGRVCMHWTPACFAQDKTGHSKNQQIFLDKNKGGSEGSSVHFLFPFFFLNNKHVIKGFNPHSEETQHDHIELQSTAAVSSARSVPSVTSFPWSSKRNITVREFYTSRWK